MKFKIVISYFTLLSATCFPLACDKSTIDALSDLADVYIPNFSNQWTSVKAAVPGFFFFNTTSVDSAKGTGAFTSFEDVTDNNGNSFVYNLKGSFDNTKVNMSFLTNEENGSDNGPQQGLSFKGIYDTLSRPFTLRLVNTNDPSDSLVLKQG